MSIAERPRLHQWSRQDYQSLVAAGVFDRQHVELIEGRIIDMSPMGPWHATAVGLTEKVLRLAFGIGWMVRRAQMPFLAADRSEPEPDVLVVRGEIRDFASAHPSSAALIVEVAETSLDFDRTEKSSIYAKAGVPDFWILNLNDRQLEVFRRPLPDATAVHGFAYAERFIVAEPDSIAPLARPDARIAVVDLLP